MNNVMFSSQSCEWETPLPFFKALDECYHFTLDVCATPKNTKCATYYTKEQNGLMKEWLGRCWMNPPYGREIGAWVKKAYESACKGTLVVCLLPARTDTAWWHDYCMKGKITFIRGRLKFGESMNAAPFPSAVVVFGACDGLEQQ
jgi:phage N-6-adenine-methyltransferase